jgi:hypothetical protein
MSHGFGVKEHRQWNPFSNHAIKHVQQNYIPNRMDPAFHGHAPKPDHRELGKPLFDANLIKMQGRPLGQESLMYGWGHGLPKCSQDEPSDIVKSVQNRRTLENVNNLDFANYYKATK